MNGWMNGWIDGWMDGQMGSISSKITPLKNNKQAPSCETQLTTNVKKAVLTESL